MDFQPLEFYRMRVNRKGFSVLRVQKRYSTGVDLLPWNPVSRRQCFIGGLYNMKCYIVTVKEQSCQCTCIAVPSCESSGTLTLVFSNVMEAGATVLAGAGGARVRFTYTEKKSTNSQLQMDR